MTGGTIYIVSTRDDGAFEIKNEAGAVVAGPFATNAAAWGWIDRNTFEGRDDVDRVNRIRTSPSFS